MNIPIEIGESVLVQFGSLQVVATMTHIGIVAVNSIGQPWVLPTEHIKGYAPLDPGSMILEPVDPAPTYALNFDYLSSDGVTKYKLVMTSAGIATCSCPGFHFRNKCRHITEFIKTLPPMVG